MKNLILIIVLLITAQSCKNGNEVESNLSGTYQGTFIRSSMTAKYMPADVTITFTEKEFSGISNTRVYPAIGEGTYQLKGNNINFFNKSIWTAEFDWSLILTGDYILTKEGNEVIIQRDYKDSNKTFDTYRLKLK